MVDVDKFTREITEWAIKTFCNGYHRTARHLSLLKHLDKEIIELKENPYSQEEIADCIILLLNLSHENVRHFGAVPISKALHDKHQKNKRRKWKRPDRNGVVEHIRSSAEALNKEM